MFWLVLLNYTLLSERMNLLESNRQNRDAERIKNSLRKEAEKLDRTTRQVEEVSGIIASSGKARGKVCKIMDDSELDKMKPGSILVTSMTSADFVPAMAIASAIVTDEGGMTCHAAIISREFGIPCIVGTKKATKLLSDNQEVEVDADNGVVKFYIQ